MRNLTLKSRLTLAFVAVILFAALLSVLSAGFITTSRSQKFALASAVKQGESLARLLERYYGQTGNWDGIVSALFYNSETSDQMSSKQGMGAMMSRIMGTTSMMMWMPPTTRTIIADSSGVIIADTDGMLPGDSYPAPRLKAGIPIGGNADPLGFVFIGAMIDLSLEPLEKDYIRSVIVAVLLVILTGAAVAFALSSAFVSRIVLPIRKVMLASREISSGNLSARLYSDRADEIGSLARSFNSMGESLQKAEDIRTQLIADIAHELRTPLSLIRGNLEAIIDGVYPMDKGAITSVHEETLFLGKLVEDLRDLSLLDADELHIEKTKVDANELIQRVCRSFDHEAHLAGVFLVRKSSSIPLMVEVDRDRIHQVFGNMLSNALRYSPQGGTVTIGVGADELESAHVEFFVTDEGPGISKRDREKIFDRFYRTDGSRTRSTGGSGLGLAISKKIIEAHGGRICVDENGASGSRFEVRLPRTG